MAFLIENFLSVTNKDLIFFIKLMIRDKVSMKMSHHYDGRPKKN